MSGFQKAIKYNAKACVALIGPAGSGKSFTMLTLARFLAGPDGKIAAIDTEHGSLSKYADQFDFDRDEPSSFTVKYFLEQLHFAEKAGYAVFCCDSLSHFWMGKDGALEFVDMASKKSSSRDGMAGWKDFSPHEREMVDAMIASPCHVICTMRTKTDYQEITDDRGKKKRVKIGLAPVQRAGLEYEFDLIGYMDDENNFVVDKTRCSALAGLVISKPSAKDFAPFKAWLSGTERPTQAPAPTPAAVTPTITPKVPATPQAAAHTTPAAANHKVITEPQRRRFYALTQTANVSPEDVKKVLKHFKYEHSVDIEMKDYDTICALFVSGEWEQYAGETVAPAPFKATDDDLPKGLGEVTAEKAIRAIAGIDDPNETPLAI